MLTLKYRITILANVKTPAFMPITKNISFPLKKFLRLFDNLKYISTFANPKNRVYLFNDISVK